VVPARGGSKGIKLKNLQLIHGTSLVGWAIKTAQRVPEITDIVLSTDSDLIAQEGIDLGVLHSHHRPSELSGDSVADFEVLRYELQRAEAESCTQFSAIVMLQPTSPFRKVEEVSHAINEVLIKGKSACWSISKIGSKYHFRKQLKIGFSGNLEKAVEGPLVKSRQELQAAYIRNGVVYAISRETLLQDPQLMGDDCSYIVLDGFRPNIDQAEELKEAISLLKVNENGDLGLSN
jgi:CMP-N-acetylneuraminic acid synthetase